MVSDHDLLVRIDEKVDHIIERLDDHESRLRPLEQQQNRWLGRDGAIVFAISFATSIAVALLSWLTGGGPR
jgi:tetrahydromethanopterin S-methyltransferase subunit B